MTARTVVVAVLLALAAIGCQRAPADSEYFVTIPGIGATRIDVPRPVTDGSATCTLELRSGDSIAERASALRAIGLFASKADLTDDALAQEIEAGIAATWGDLIGPDDPLLELFVAEQDGDRVWWRDLEADVADGNFVYASTLAEWAAISDGAFAPAHIEESWGSDSGPVSVTFDLAGIAQVIEPAYLEDWIDPRIATPINALIAPSGRQFVFVKAFDQTAFVMALPADERAALEGRGWCFE